MGAGESDDDRVQGGCNETGLSPDEIREAGRWIEERARRKQAEREQAAAAPPRRDAAGPSTTTGTEAAE